MTLFRPKSWTALGAALVLASCGGEGGEAGKGGEAGEGASAPAVGEGGEGEGGGAEAGAGGEAGAAGAYQSVDPASRLALRIAHLKGFVLAAQAAAPVEGADAAAVLVGQGMAEVFDPHADALRRAGVDESALRKAAGGGTVPELNAAIRTLDAAYKRAGGDQAAIAKGLTEIAIGLYDEILIEGGMDTVEYQHSYGAALAAQSVVRADPKLSAARPEYDRFVRMWKEPVAPEDPKNLMAPSVVMAQASRAELALTN